MCPVSPRLGGKCWEPRSHLSFSERLLTASTCCERPALARCSVRSQAGDPLHSRRPVNQRHHHLPGRGCSWPPSALGGGHVASGPEAPHLPGSGGNVRLPTWRHSLPLSPHHRRYTEELFFLSFSQEGTWAQSQLFVYCSYSLWG